MGPTTLAERLTAQLTPIAELTDEIISSAYEAYSMKAVRKKLPDVPSLSTSGETLTIEELLTLRARTENAGDAEHEHEWSWAGG